MADSTKERYTERERERKRGRMERQREDRRGEVHWRCVAPSLDPCKVIPWTDPAIPPVRHRSHFLAQQSPPVLPSTDALYGQSLTNRRWPFFSSSFLFRFNFRFDLFSRGGFLFLSFALYSDVTPWAAPSFSNCVFFPASAGISSADSVQLSVSLHEPARWLPYFLCQCLPLLIDITINRASIGDFMGDLYRMLLGHTSWS